MNAAASGSGEITPNRSRRRCSPSLSLWRALCRRGGFSPPPSGPPKRCPVTRARPASPARPATPPFRNSPRSAAALRSAAIRWGAATGRARRSPRCTWRASPIRSRRKMRRPPRAAHQRQPRLPAGLRLYRRPALRQSRLVHSDYWRPCRGTAFVDASDIRYADTLKLFGKDTIWGIDANNTPTVEDPWNTTPSFGWPQSPRPSRPPSGRRRPTSRTDMARSSAAQAHTFLERHAVRRLTSTRDFPFPCCRLSTNRQLDDGRVSNVAPYWRVALEPHWGDHY